MHIVYIPLITETGETWVQYRDGGLFGPSLFFSRLPYGNTSNLGQGRSAPYKVMYHLHDAIKAELQITK